MQDDDPATRPASEPPRSAVPVAGATDPGLTGGVDPGGTGPAEGRFSHRPPGYPNAFVWLRAGIVRDWRGALGAFIATWFYLPVALLSAVASAIGLGAAGFYAGGFGTPKVLPPELLDVPLVGTLLDTFVVRSGGVLGGLAGVGVGFVGGFLAIVILPWRATLDEPATLITGLAGVVVAAALVGLLYTLYRVLLEPWLLGVSGARRLSRREAATLVPVLHECARGLELPSVPRLLIEDQPLTNARAYSRHIVVTTGLLAEGPDEMAALLSHELVHWRTGDEVTSAFLRGVALPLFLVHAVPTWLMRRFPHPGTNFVVFLLFWPVLLTMKYVVMPFHARDVRQAEYRADLGAVLTGHLTGLRSILEDRKAFEIGRSGWDEAVCATHPPNELRLDRLEEIELAAEDVPDEATVPAGVTGSGTAEGGSEPSLADLFGGPSTFGSRRSWLIASAAVLACCAVSSMLGVVQWTFFQPADAVHGYFSALADHDGQAALDRLDADQRASLGAEPYLVRLVKSKDYQPPTDVSVRQVDRDDDRATAVVTYKLAGTPVEQRVTLRRDAETTMGLFHGWHLADGLGNLSFAGGQVADQTDDQPPPQVQLNGVQVSLPEGATVVVPPGGYVLAGTANPLSEMAPRTVFANFASNGGQIDLSPTLREDARAKADDAIKRYLDGCAAQRVAAPAGCPFSYSYYGENPQQISWKITKYPQAVVELVNPATARVSTPNDAQGVARVTGRSAQLYGGTPFQDQSDFSVNGTITVVGDDLTFQPNE